MSLDTPEREVLMSNLNNDKNNLRIREFFQRDSGHIVFADIFTFLKETGILKRNILAVL